jgi:hypothetical protein
MFKKLLLTLSLFFLTTAQALQIEPRLLARVGDTSITTLDVKRKMDFVFQQHYPQYAKDPIARYEFYKNSWQGVLRDMVQTEMILAYVAAQEEKFQQKIVSQGDIHRELHDRFGPDVMGSLSNIGMTYEEGCEMLKREMQVGNMLYVSVQDKVKKQVRPEDIRLRYVALCSEMKNKKRWRYQVVTIEGEDRAAGAAAAHTALKNEGLTVLTSLSEKAASLAQTADIKNSYKISLSSTVETGEDDIAPERAATLSKLTPGTFSEPVDAVQRKSKKPVKQIFVLHNTIESQPPSFASKQAQLQSEITNEIYSKEMERFMGQLEERFPAQIFVAEGDNPFSGA